MNKDLVEDKARKLIKVKKALEGEGDLSEKEFEEIQEYMHYKNEERNAVVNENKYYVKASEIINNPEFKLNHKVSKQETSFILDHFVHKKPLDECKSYLKRIYKLNDQDAVKMVRRLKNQFKHFEKSIK